MLPVTAIQNRTPVTFVVFFKTRNSVFHRFVSKVSDRTWTVTGFAQKVVQPAKQA